MNVHEEFAGDLALHALGTLDATERTPLQKHLDECADCRHELELMRGDMALLALSAAGPHPPQRSKQRLMDAISREPKRVVKPKRWAWLAPMPWLAAAGLAIVAANFWRQNTDLKSQLAQLESDVAHQQIQLEKAREIVATLTAPDAQVVTVVEMNKLPQPQGKAIYMRNRGSLIFVANNIPAVPSQKMYELWLIPMQGAPIPAGMFKPDARGSATLVNPPLPVGVEAKAFAITMEPEQGSPTPTMPIMMTGAGE